MKFYIVSEIAIRHSQEEESAIGLSMFDKVLGYAFDFFQKHRRFVRNSSAVKG